MNVKRHRNWLIAALVFGAVVLPFLVYYTGVLTIGPYARGGAGAFYANFWADVLQLRAAPWLLLIGPAILVILWRLLAAYAAVGNAEERPDGPR